MMFWWMGQIDAIADTLLFLLSMQEIAKASLASPQPAVLMWTAHPTTAKVGCTDSFAVI